MAVLNANAKFTEYKATTVPVHTLPRNVREFLCIDKIYENGMFKIEPCETDALYDRCFLFEDINYVTQDEVKQRTVLDEIVRFFKSMSRQFKITVASEHQDMDTFLQEIYRPVHAKEYPVLDEGMTKFIDQKINEGKRDIRRTLLLTVTTRASSYDEAWNDLSTFQLGTARILESIGSRLYALSAKERLAILQPMLRAGERSFLPSADLFRSEEWKDQILPAGIRSEDQFLHINNRCSCVLFVMDYDASLNENETLYTLTDVPFPVYVTIDMQLIPQSVLKNKLIASHTNNERSIATERDFYNKSGQYTASTSYGLSRKKEELENLIDQVDGEDEAAVYVGFLVLVSADDVDTLDKRVHTLKKRAEIAKFTLEEYFYQQLPALNTVLPIGGRQVNFMRAFLTKSAVAFQPFHATDLQDRDGYIYGLNRTTGMLLRGNRKLLRAAHGFIVGHTGSGKTFLIRMTEGLQTLLLTDDDIIFLDPKNEQMEFVRGCGGEYFDLTPQSGIYMNPFEVPEKIRRATDQERKIFIAQKVDYAASFAACIMTNIVVTQLHVNYIERAVNAMYDEYFSQKRPQGQPTMIRFCELLSAQMSLVQYEDEKRMILEIVQSLEKYTNGSYDMFAHESNIDMDNRLIGFGLHNIPENLWEAAMLTIMSYLEQQIYYNDEHRAIHLVIDETQYLCARESTANQLLHAVELYRSFGVIITLAAQNLTRVLENEKLRDMFSNCPFKCFLDQGGVDAEKLSQIHELSEVEYKALTEGKGRGVLIFDRNTYLFDALMDKSNPLYWNFTTDFHEKAAAAKKGEGAGNG